MRFAVSIPQLDTSGFDAAGLRSYLARAEEAGFESAWTIEQTLGPTPMIAPLPLLAYAAGCTERLRLGVGVLVSSQHDPLHLAGTITAVDRLCHGRLEVGVSAGGGFRNFAAFGVDRDTFVSYFTEGLELMKAAWSDEESITFHGRFRDVDDVAISPKPVQRPHPPIWFGASAPTSIARAVEHGDAFLGAGSSTTAKFAGQVQLELPDRKADLPRRRQRCAARPRPGQRRAAPHLWLDGGHRGRRRCGYCRQRGRRVARGRGGRCRADRAQPTRRRRGR
jgi:alkanesulfonate monooxygenase SsuD/methylene tetrahydromethanopterin reductase-like flavin-dependent oxidoreductase (luciferase family)